LARCEKELMMSQDIFVVIEHLRGEVAEISYVMLAAARQLAQATGGDVVAVLLGHQAQGLAGTLAADSLVYMDDPALVEFTSDAYLKILPGILEQAEPRAVLFGHTSIGTDVASGLSIKMGYPLISQCQRFVLDDSPMKFECQICGGKISAEGELPGETTLLTLVPGVYKPDEGTSSTAPEISTIEAPALDDLRVTLTGYVEPEAGDVDISRETFLIAVGRGIRREDNLEVARELADALGGAVCASRPVVDQGWLPTSRMVGKSGKAVKPSVYLALGISGAPEHVEGVRDSDVIIAINTDPAAPIFDIAKYGATIDILDIMPALTEAAIQAKGA
jgi:electron transfer flavoprotein alpha subunit